MEVYIIGLVIFVSIALLIAGLRKVSIGYTLLWCLLTPLAGILYASLKKKEKSRMEIQNQTITEKFNYLNQLKFLKDEGILSDEEFEQKKKLLKQDLETPINCKYITIRHLKGKPETITIKQWEKIKNDFGQENYEVLGYY